MGLSKCNPIVSQRRSVFISYFQLDERQQVELAYILDPVHSSMPLI